MAAAAPSPLSPVTLSKEARSQAGIVQAAASFAWVYPLDGVDAIDDNEKGRLLQSHPHFSFLFFGLLLQNLIQLVLFNLLR